MEAFKKDLASDPELAAKYGVRVRSEAGTYSKNLILCISYSRLVCKQVYIDQNVLQLFSCVLEKEAERKKKEKESDTARQKALEAIEKKRKEGEWHEAKSAEGYTYYWNTVTHGKGKKLLFCISSHSFRHCNMNLLSDVRL